MIGEARFDWYQGTFSDLDHEQVSTSLALAHGASTAPARALYGYAAAQAVEKDGEQLAVVFGRSSRAGEVHVQVTSGACDALVPTLRTLWPEHRVSRADSALDFEGDFASLDEVVLGFAQERGLRHRLVTDSEGGATRYVGSPSSEVMVRLYKKSEQLRAAHPEKAAMVPDGILRAECQVRPSKAAAKESAAKAAPEDLWGLAEWSTRLGEEVLMLKPARTVTHVNRSSDWTRALYFLGQQYGPGVQARLRTRDRAEVVADVLEALGLGEPA